MSVGLEYQILAGPSYIAVFTVFLVAVGIAADRLGRRNLIMAVGFTVLSLSCLLTGFAGKYWHLVVARMGTAAGKID